MIEHSVLCQCGTMMVPVLLEEETQKKLIRSAYCPECIFYEFPNLNFFSKAFIIEATDPLHDGIPFPIDHKTSACYSVDFGGFFAVRFDIFVKDAHYFFRYNVPFRDSVIVLPECFKCKALQLVGWHESNNGGWHLEKKCKYIIGRNPQNMINFKCKNFEEME